MLEYFPAILCARPDWVSLENFNNSGEEEEQMREVLRGPSAGLQERELSRVFCIGNAA